MKLLRRIYQSQISTQSKPSLLAWLLSPISLVFYIVNRVWNSLFEASILKKNKFDKQIISIGNITVGGAGKTPCVMAIYEWIAAAGKKAKIVLRGYGQDETKVLEQFTNGNVLSGVDRSSLIQGSLAKEPNTDLFILDDGYQHRKVERDLNILLINALNPFGNGFLLPGGSLREPLSSIKRADAVILTHSDEIPADRKEMLKAKILSYAPQVKWVEARHEPFSLYDSAQKTSCDLSRLKEKPVIAFSGLAQPIGFKKSLEKMGANVVEFIEFSDHEEYSSWAIHEIQARANNYSDPIFVTTEKDFFRSSQILKKYLDVYVLQIEFKWVLGEDELKNEILSL